MLQFVSMEDSKMEFNIELRDVNLNTTEFLFDIGVDQTKSIILDAIDKGFEILVIPKV